MTPPARRRLPLPVLLLLAAALSAGCATVEPEPREFTLEEIRALVQENNEDAAAYQMGTGDGAGASIYDRYVDKVIEPD